MGKCDVDEVILIRLLSMTAAAKLRKNWLVRTLSVLSAAEDSSPLDPAASSFSWLARAPWPCLPTPNTSTSTPWADSCSALAASRKALSLATWSAPDKITTTVARSSLA